MHEVHKTDGDEAPANDEQLDLYVATSGETQALAGMYAQVGERSRPAATRVLAACLGTEAPSQAGDGSCVLL